MYERPLVSVRIPNYNYGRYLEYCLNSVLQQTYDNFEVFFRDNDSTDNSYDIALEYQEKFRKRGIFCSVVRNKRNVGSDKNSDLLNRNTEGNLQYVLASDDAIRPDFLEKTVEVFEKYPRVGMVMTNREEIDDDGRIYPVPPFYNESCIVDGESQAAVFMMAGIAIPGQRIFRRDALLKTGKYYGRNYRVAGDWYYNFLKSCTADIAYLREPLCQYRIHRGNETNVSENSLNGIFEHYLLINEFVRVSKQFHYKKPAQRYDEAVDKLAHMCKRYAINFLKHGNKTVADKYLKLAIVLNPEIEMDTQYVALKQMLGLSQNSIEKELEKKEWQMEVQRTISYDPPQGFIKIQ